MPFALDLAEDLALRWAEDRTGVVVFLGLDFAGVSSFLRFVERGGESIQAVRQLKAQSEDERRTKGILR